MQPHRSLQLSFWLPGCVCEHSHVQGEERVVQGFAPTPFCLEFQTFPIRSRWLKINTRDLSGLVGGGAGVRRLRPQGQRPARSGPSEELAQGHMCPLLFPPGVLQVLGQGSSAGFGVEGRGSDSFVATGPDITTPPCYWICQIPLRGRTQGVTQSLCVSYFHPLHTAAVIGAL